jgi:hypothetical protein
MQMAYAQQQQQLDPQSLFGNLLQQQRPYSSYMSPGIFGQMNTGIVPQIPKFLPFQAGPMAAAYGAGSY